MSDKLLMIGGLIAVGGIIPVFILASMFGSSLPGWVLLIPISLGGLIMLWPMIFGSPVKIPNRRIDEQ